MVILDWLTARTGDIEANLLADVVWASVGIGLTILAASLRRRLRKLRAGRMWSYFLSQAVIVIGIHDESYFPGYWEGSGFVGSGDVRTLRILTEHLGDLKAKGYVVKLASELSDSDWQKDLILIGGPSANAASKSVLAEMTVLSFGDGGHNLQLWHSARSEDDGLIFTDHIHGEQPNAWKDYGAIVWGVNPAAQRRRFLMLAGGTGVGTEATAWRVISRDFVSQPLVRGTGNFIETFKLDVNQRRPGLPQARVIAPY